jgi:UDP-4-amino-4,6-dideoxy-N-acetyl-beta-L-altrosamine N-acetyltransferase
MYYLKFGFKLSLLKESDLEMVRRWRNAPHITQNMEFREFITPEMQQNWFRSINNIHNLYFVIEYKGEKIGLTNGKNLDFENSTGEAGIFLYEKKYQKTPVPAILAIMGAEIFFDLFKWNAAYAHVLKENRAMKMYVQFLGYRLCEGQEGKINQKYQMTRETYNKNKAILRKAMSLVVKMKEKGRLVIEREDFTDERILFWEEHLLKNNPAITMEVTEEGRIYNY